MSNQNDTTESHTKIVTSESKITPKKSIIEQGEHEKQANGVQENQKAVHKGVGPYQVIRSDSTYLLQFNDEEGNSIGHYDIWGNNPFEFNLEKFDPTPGMHPMRYKVPYYTKDQLFHILPEALFKNIQPNITIGRLDVYVSLPHRPEHFRQYIPVLYQINAMLGHTEEYFPQASIGLINILNSKGKIWQSIHVNNTINLFPSVSQDGKYLVYGRTDFIAEQHNCFDVYDLQASKIVYSNCVDTDYELHGTFLYKENLIGLGIAHKLDLNYLSYYILDSKKDNVYHKVDNSRHTAYEIIDNGVIVKLQNQLLPDTLLFDEVFTTIKLK